MALFGMAMKCGVCGSGMSFFEKRCSAYNSAEIINVYICPHCHFLSTPGYLDNNIQAEGSQHFYDDWIENTDDVQRKVEQLKKALICFFLEYIRDPSKKNLLDYGCGAGLLTLAAAQSGFAGAFGVDVNVVTGGKLKELHPEQTNLAFYKSLRELPKKVDVVVLWHVLEHVENPYRFLKDLGSYCAGKGTMLFFQVPQYDSRYLYKGHCRFYAEPSIKMLFKRLGHTIIQIGYDVENAFMTVVVKTS